MPLHALGPLAAVVAGNRRHTSALKQKGGMLSGGECVRPPRRPRACTRALRSGDGGYACTCGLSGRLYSTQASVAGLNNAQIYAKSYVWSAHAGSGRGSRTGTDTARTSGFGTLNIPREAMG